MKVYLYYRFSGLDKRHEYSVVCGDDNKYLELWLWFYLGRFCKECEHRPMWWSHFYKKLLLFPFVTHDYKDKKSSKFLKEYNCYDSEKTAKCLVKRINTHFKNALLKEARKK